MIVNEDCNTGMLKLEDNSVNLWITSPPYADKRDYAGASESDYVEWLSNTMVIARQKLTQDGSIVVNIKECCKDGQRSLYVFKLIINLVENVGLRLIDEYIWNKTNPFPTGSKKRLKDSYERCLHFTKSSNYKFFPESTLKPSTSVWLQGEKNRGNKGVHNTTNGSGMNMSKRVANDLVRSGNVITGSTSNINIGHPAVFPTYLPEFFIKLLTEEGDIVGDMYCGSGSSGVAAMNCNRQFIGFEIDAEYCKIAESRMNIDD